MAGNVDVQWTQEELAVIDANLDAPLEDLAELLGRDPYWVSRARARLASPTLSDPWSVEEDRFMLATPHLTAAQVARKLGRTTTAVHSRRKLLGDAHGVKFGTGSNKSPHQIGARPLIAKTCSKCGELRAAEWFSYSPTQNGVGGWKPACRKCLSTVPLSRTSANTYHGSDRYREMTKVSRKRLQDLTVPYASRSGMPWLEEDHAVLRDPDLTLVEKAVSLKRSYNAVSIMCSTNGYSSHTGLGSADDVWRIFNPNEGAA